MDKTETDKKAEAWADMSDGEEAEHHDNMEAEEKKVVKKKNIPKAQKGVKNDRGDYVVTKIEIADARADAKKERENAQKDEDSDSDTEYDDEDDVKEEAKEEEPK